MLEKSDGFIRSQRWANEIAGRKEKHEEQRESKKTEIKETQLAIKYITHT